MTTMPMKIESASTALALRSRTAGERSWEPHDAMAESASVSRKVPWPACSPAARRSAASLENPGPEAFFSDLHLGSGQPTDTPPHWLDLATLNAATAAAARIESPFAQRGIDHVTTISDAIFALEELGLQWTAKHVAHLNDLCREDLDKADVDLESLKRLVRVMQTNRAWGEPELALADGGSIHAEWSVDGGGRVTIEFLPENRVDYTASNAPVTDYDALDIAGRHLEEEAIRNLRWFTDRIAAR